MREQRRANPSSWPVKAIFTAGLAPTFWPDAPVALPTQAPALALVEADDE